MIRWFFAEFRDRDLEHRYRLWRYDAALTQYTVVGWLLIVATFPYIMQMWRNLGPSPEFYLIAALRSVQFCITVLVLVWAYQRKPFQQLDLIAAVCLCALVTVNMTAMLHIKGTGVMMFLQVLLVTAFAYILFPGRLIHTVVPLTLFAFGFIAALYLHFQVEDIVKSGLTAWALVANAGGYLAARQFAIFRRREFASVLEAEARAIDLEEARAAAEEARREAEEANRAKSAMLANTSHELRTPLNAIIGFSELMSRQMLGPIGNERYRGYADDILNSGKHLLSLIDDLLDLSKIEAGKTELHPEWLDPDVVSETARELCRARAVEKEQQITILPPPEPVELFADKRAVIQILVNLVSNAVKFSESGETITIAWRAGAADGLTMAVEDNGVGIDAEDVARLLKPFEQAEDDPSKPREGWGLGLALVASLCRHHDAGFALAPRPRGGTSATVAFPPARVQPGTTSPEALKAAV